MKIVTVVGARPQFVKSGIVSLKLRENHKEIIIHTGQHYDYNMSEAIFNDLNMPVPDYNLEVGSGSHGMQTGRMLEKIESILILESPVMVLVYGDTNSTIAGALAASKLHIPVMHIEAGLRSFNMRMPEEQNRILTDHISTILACPTITSVKNLKKEGIQKGVFHTGDVMYDAALYALEIASKKSNILEREKLERNNFLLCTVHRAENTDDFEKLGNIFEGISSLEQQIIIPLHPRTKKIVETNVDNIKINKKYVKIIDPVSYLDMIQLEKNASCIVTDSGGVQKEAYFFKKPCITLRNETEWVETLADNWNQVVGTDMKKIQDAFHLLSNLDYTKKSQGNYYGNGDAVDKIIQVIKDQAF